MTMQAFGISLGVVALAEMGDKTQLLAFVLAAKFRQPISIILGILVATLVNHTLASALGIWLTAFINPHIMQWILVVAFILMGLWMLVPDKCEEHQIKLASFGVFLTTLLAFFLAEMGDKTQIATVALAARYQSVLGVIMGTTCGMLLADVPAVFLGEHFANRISLKWVRAAAAFVFIMLGVVALWTINNPS